MISLRTLKFLRQFHQKIMKDPKLPCVLISGYEDLYSVNKDHVGDLKKHFNLITMQEFLENKPNFSQKIKAIYVWGGKPWIDQELLQSLPTLKIIANLGAGLDHLDLNMIASFGVKLANTKHAVTNSTADMGMALLLASARRLLEGYEVATSPDTKSFSINWMGQEVTGSTLGIIGQLVDQDALVEALQTGIIRAAGLDVTYPEPLPSLSHVHLDGCMVLGLDDPVAPRAFMRHLHVHKVAGVVLNVGS